MLKNLYSRLLKSLGLVVNWLTSALKRVESWVGKVDDFLSTKPFLRKAAVGVSFVFGPPFSILLILGLIISIETPGKRELSNIRNQVASEVYSADSVLLGRYFIQDRTEVRYEDIAPVVVDALIATEDVRFYEHQGIDFVSLARVLVKSVFMQDESAGGGSTITQQLAKNLYPRKRYLAFSILINKLREIVIARRLERIYSKKELITLYLNTIPFADNTFGIESAAKRFYSVPAKDLKLGQAAMLVGMLKATHNYNPRRNPKRALARRNVVLGQMVKYNFLDERVADSAQKLPLDLNYNMVSHHQGLAPYFREYLKSELLQWCKQHKKKNGDPYNLYTDGLKVYTTIQSKMQLYGEQALAKQMADVQKQFFDHWRKELPWQDKTEVVTDAIHRTVRYQRLKEQGLTEDEIREEFKKPVATRLFTWDGEKEVTASPLDSIIHHLQYLNAGFLVVEPQTGRTLVWVGGIEHDFFQYDHVKLTTKRQVGSIFKPIVYALAVEQGMDPCELISASQETYIDKEGDKWTPRNMQNDYKVNYTMRGGLAYSVNTVSVKLIQRAGVNQTISLARKMGIQSELPDVPSIALGSSSISLLEMTNAFACLANDGVYQPVYYIDKIVDLEGTTYDDFKGPGGGRRALSSETTQLVRQMLQTVVHEGTASRLRWKYGVYSDVAGKTGTTQANADGWFMGYTPTLAIGAWVGADDPRIRFRYSKLGQGANTALPIAAYFLKELSQDETFSEIANAKFKPLPYDLQQLLQCDLYELDEDLNIEIEQSIQKRDSLIQSDTLARPPEETFLQMLYRRKQKRRMAMQARDSLAIEEIGG